MLCRRECLRQIGPFMNATSPTAMNTNSAMAARAEAELMFIAIGEVAFIEQADLLQTFAPAKHQCAMGHIHDLRDPG